MKHRSLTRQSGFTLVEIAIVLVMIGLLLGGVLKGQEMIGAAKAKNLMNDMKSVSTAFSAYQEKYKAVPGDDVTASTRFTGAVDGGGNGVIAGAYNALTTPLVAGSESNNFWQHMRMAGLMGGAVTATAALPPQNAVGGLLGVQQPAATSFGINGPVVCAGSVPWKIALAADIAMDDGVSDTGDFRAGPTSANLNVATVAAAGTNAAAGTGYGPLTPATAALEAGFHTVCMKIRT